MKGNSLIKEKVKIKVKIVKMVKKDLHVLLKLGKAHWGDEGNEWLTMEYLKVSFDQPGFNYVAKVDGKVIGGVIFVKEDIVKNWIRYLIVDKNYRRMGAGRTMLGKIFTKIKSGESIFVDTGVIDKKAIMFYEKLGFKNRGMVKSLYGNMPAYFFEKTF